MATSRSPLSLDELKLAIARVSPAPSHAPAVAPLSTGWDAVDALLSGGLPRGRVIEISGARSSGKASLALAAAARVMRDGRTLVAWVDGTAEFYPPAAALAGVALDQLLIVHAGHDGESAARAGEILARCRAFALVVLDLPPSRTFPDRAAARLRAAAHESGVTITALTSRPGALPHAGLELQVIAAPGTPDAPGVRRHQIIHRRGGQASPGAHAGVLLASSAMAGFRSPSLQASLLSATDGIRPVRVPLSPRPPRSSR